MMEFEIGDKSVDGVIEILAKDSLCYQVRSVSRGATGVRTISRRLLDEWVLALEANPDKSGGEIRDLLSGRSEIDKFEYGYFATLQKMASMALGKEPMTRVVRSASPIGKLQKITYGAPGTGKSKQTKDEVAGHVWFRTTFHPDSDYASFVGAYKPMMKEDGVALTEVSQKDAAGQLVGTEIHDQRKGIAYDFVDQVFTKAYVEAWKLQKNAAVGATPEPVFLVIEEINRGNCAQIFGDIFQLLDRNTKGFSEYSIMPDSDLGRFIGREIAKEPATFNAARADMIQSLYPDATFKVVEDVLAGKRLLLPDNLYIRATMNTSDQSLFPMDSAFKRRWDWKYVPIGEGLDKDTKQPLGWKIKLSDCEVDWWKFLIAINKVVKGVTNSADKQMGYFFVRAKDSVIDAEMFVNKVAFYLWNDVFKDCELDGDAFKITREGGEVDVLAFQDFFKEDGAVNEEVLKNFLTTLVPPPEAASAETGAASAVGGEP